MKTKVLFAAALLLSTATFAQSLNTKTEQTTSTRTQAGNSGIAAHDNINSSSDLTLKSGSADKTVQKDDQAKQEPKKPAVTQKEAVKARAHADVEAVQKMETGNTIGSGRVRSDVQAGSESKNNKVSQEAYINQHTAASAETFKGSGKDAERQGQTKLNTQTASIVQSTDYSEKQTEKGLIKTSAKAKKEAKMANGNAKTSANACSKTAINAGTGIAAASKPKPASFKMQSQIKGSAGLRFK